MRVEPVPVPVPHYFSGGRVGYRLERVGEV